MPIIYCPIPLPSFTSQERFWAKVAVAPNSCWLWHGAVTRGGYGQFKVDGITRRAHRIAYLSWYGELPTTDLHHVCETRLCVRPDHLQPISRADHILLTDTFTADNARKTHCKWGHEFTSENTYLWRNARICRACRAERRTTA